MKLALGTVQFGLDYGISNPLGKTPPAEVRTILNCCQKNHIDFFDTAPLYGTSEKVLGCTLPSQFGKIITKTPHFQNKKIVDQDANLLNKTFIQSLKNLKRTKIYGLLIHDADDLLKPGGEILFNSLLQLKEQKKISKLGVSVYNASQIDAIVDTFPIELIQIPLNIFDQRLIHGGQLQHLKDQGIEVHARSVFLQGLLLMQENSLPPWFDSIKGHLKSYHAYITQHNLTYVQAALGFVCSLQTVDKVVCGVNTLQQLKELIRAAHTSVNPDSFSHFKLETPDILDPSRWPIQP